jgi:hypothetical protein
MEEEGEGGLICNIHNIYMMMMMMMMMMNLQKYTDVEAELTRM